ncbi:DUF5946 family protein [Pseudonocardia abyssalis]|uniref:Uncharacterized protein n=1 Tax=Pseudonocardia abyssalis TaxID=2792008 RepID=A0ABS6V0N3_9PSEU|nr:DUF5946 family protein [Pseudonocardia abyssalis]MBW0115118.1 hypothetical protein [Pseudonocardia abyssalis]MBW0137957.1 hypothetical protein [Pseudonocardia abyssalis]
MTDDCPGCGTGDGPPVPSAACAERALVVAEREFSDPAYFAVHRITVAAYTLQHPASSSGHAVAVHLAALRGAVEQGLDADALGRHVRWASDALRRRPTGPLVPPARRGALTIVDVVAARDAGEHCTLVRRWAAQVREAWRPVADMPEV